MLNPYDPLSNPYLRQQQGPPPIQPLTPAEEDSLLSRIGGKVLGGLGYAGSVLEKTFGGRAVRGLLGGKPRELLSVLPFSDTLGITDEQDRVSGQELLGLGHDSGWGGTLAGIGAEIALDPATYLTLGTGAALSGAGRVASKIGVLPRAATGRVTGTLRPLLAGAQPTTQAAAEAAAGGAAKLATLLDEPLAGVAGLGLPFARPSVLLGTGASGEKVLQGLSTVGHAVDAGARRLPLVGHAWDLAGKGLDTAGRYLNAWFDPAVMGATSHLGQEVAREAHGEIRPLVAAARGRVADYGQELVHGGIPATDTGATLRQVAEVGAAPTTAAEQQVAAKMMADYEKELNTLQQMGVDVGPLRDDFAQFLSRQKTPLAKPTRGYSRPQQPLVSKDARIESREEILKNIPGGTESINRMALDPAISGPTRTAGTPANAAEHLRANYLGMSGTDEQEMFRLNQLAKNGGQLSPAEEAGRAALNQKWEQSHRLADWLGSLDPQYAASAGGANPLRFFGNHPLQDYLTYFERTSRLRGAGEAAHNLLARTAIDTTAAGAQVPQNAKRLFDALKDAGLDYQVANAPVGGRTTLADRLSQRLGTSISAADLDRFVVPGETAAELTRYLRGFSNPESLNPILRLYDYLTNITKTFQTATWPAFHVRNLVSGMWQNLVKGGFEPGRDPVSGFIKPMLDAKRLMGGGIIPDANTIADLAHLTPEAATQALAKEMYTHGVSGHTGSVARDIVSQQGLAGAGPAPSLGDLLKQIPGQDPKSLTGALSTLGTSEGRAWSPLNVAGAGSNVDLFAPVVAGRQVGDVVEGVNRGSLYLALRRQGYTPEQAAKHVLEAHFDYSRAASTDVEAGLLKRLIPFYTWSRRNVPFQLEQLIAHPGGLAATEAKIAQDLRQQAGFLPDYLGAGLAVPVGEESGGTQRYLTRLDLPPEQAFENLRGGPGALPKSLMSLLGQVNPAIKAPLEFATGKQFFTGRDLEDLYTMTGSTGLDQLLMNSPLSRGLTTARTLADERKWAHPEAIPINLLTGAKLTDVDMAKQRNIAGREFLTEVLRGVPAISKFETLSVRPGMVGQLTPEEMELMRLNRTLELRAQQAAREKRIRVGG